LATAGVDGGRRAAQPRARRCLLFRKPPATPFSLHRQQAVRGDQRLHAADVLIATNWEKAMSVYIIAQLKFTERERYDRYQARFMGVFKNFKGKLLVADDHPVVLDGDWPRDQV